MSLRLHSAMCPLHLCLSTGKTTYEGKHQFFSSTLVCIMFSYIVYVWQQLLLMLTNGKLNFCTCFSLWLQSGLGYFQMANARSDECHFSVCQLIFCALQCRPIPGCWNETFFGLLFMYFSRLVMPLLLPLFFEIIWFISMLLLFVLKSLVKMWNDFQHWSLGSLTSDLPSLQLIFPAQATASLLPAAPTISRGTCRVLCATPNSHSNFQVSKPLHCKNVLSLLPFGRCSGTRHAFDARSEGLAGQTTSLTCQI